jgi:hypothetical protein
VDKIGANDTLFQVHARDLKTFTWISWQGDCCCWKSITHRSNTWRV